MPKLKIKKGDNVVVISGRDKGKQGEVLRVFPAESRLVEQTDTGRIQGSRRWPQGPHRPPLGRSARQVR
jgi:ribosomal protein L24